MRNLLGAFLLFVVMAWASQAMAADYGLHDLTGTDDKVTNCAMVALNVGILLDWGQTNNGADRFDGSPGRTGLSETNPALGRYPNDGEVNRVMIANLVLYNAAGYFMPEHIEIFGVSVPAKKVFYIASTLYRYDAVFQNHELGLHVNF